jgi:hypothetical protein
LRADLSGMQVQIRTVEISFGFIHSFAQNNFCAKIMKRHLDREHFPRNKSRETVHVRAPRALPT